jgi:hypothetical protein
MLFLIARPQPLVSMVLAVVIYVHSLKKSSMASSLLITLPSDIHGNNMSEECFFLREKKKDRQADRFHCKSGTQNSNINGNFKKSKSVDRFRTKIDRSTDEQTTDFIFRDTLIQDILMLALLLLPRLDDRGT